jgi:hypothetical protein
MTKNKQITDTLNNVVSLLEQNPETGKDTTITTSVLEDGFKCIVKQGDHSAIVDMSEAMGGVAAGPSPGFFGRAGLISCIAIGLKITALRAGIELDEINVDVKMIGMIEVFLVSIMSPPDQKKLALQSLSRARLQRKLFKPSSQRH